MLRRVLYNSRLKISFWIRNLRWPRKQLVKLEILRFGILDQMINITTFFAVCVKKGHEIEPWCNSGFETKWSELTTCFVETLWTDLQNIILFFRPKNIFIYLGTLINKIIITKPRKVFKHLKPLNSPIVTASVTVLSCIPPVYK